MICPHCKKPISWKIDSKAREKVIKLSKQGYSVRDVSKLLLDEGIQCSFATVSRILREKK